MKSPPRWVLLLSVPLAACGNEPAASPASDDAIAARAHSAGVAPEAVYAVSLDGFAPAAQSVGVHGDAGFSAAYTSPQGGIAMLTTDPRGMTDAECADRPLATAAGATAIVECAADQDGWYRVSGDQHEYVALHGGVAVALSTALGAIDEDTLRAAVAGAHRPTDDELAQLFPSDESGGEAPVERGDLPPVGDGAPAGPEGAAG